MGYEHRSTPLVHAPALGLTAPERGRARELRAPIVVVTSSGEWELERGQLLIGRGAESQILLEDSLVSRQHARILVAEGELVSIEDLHSTNGVFINGIRLSRPSAQLREGDRLLVGTTEISVFSNQHSGKIPLHHRVVQANGHVVAAIPRTRVAAPVNRSAPGSATPVPGMFPAPSTERADAFSLVRNLADRMMASGQASEAVQTLSEHLNHILLGASNGLSAQPFVLEHASRCASKLYSWTKRPSWLDYVFELHLVCQRAPSSATLDLLEALLPGASGIDSGLVRYLIQAVRERAGTSQDEMLSADRLERLLT